MLLVNVVICCPNFSIAVLQVVIAFQYVFTFWTKLRIYLAYWATFAINLVMLHLCLVIFALFKFIFPVNNVCWALAATIFPYTTPILAATAATAPAEKGIAAFAAANWAFKATNYALKVTIWAFTWVKLA